MRGRTLYLLKTYIAVVIIFILAKPAFMMCNREGHTFSMADMAEVVGHGLSLDLSTSIYFLLLPYLIIIASLWTSRWSLLRNILKAYSAIAALLIAVGVVADSTLYGFWGFKLDASCLEYIDSPEAATSSVSAAFLLVRIAVLTVLAFCIYKLLVWLTPTSVTRLSTRQSIAASVVAVLLVCPIVIGIRGGVNESTTNVGQVYYSQDQFLNHSAVNPVFSFMASFEKSVSDNNNYDYFSSEECDKILSGIYFTDDHAEPNDTALSGIDTLLACRRPSVIVIILLESCGAEFTELGGMPDVMPCLNKIAHEGVCFTHCYANSWRTDRGTVCSLSGYPSFPATSVMKMPSKTRHLPSIARSLQAEGYATYYLYGGDINFTNMRSYLISTGWETLTSMDDYSPQERLTAKWGVRDDITFQTLLDMITDDDNTSSHRLIGFSTLSSHEPWDVPISKIADEKLNAFYYLDQCIGSLVERLRATPLWDDMLLVMLPDHAINYKDIVEGNPMRNRIPMVWTGGAVKEPRRVDVICNQTDLAATLLCQMGIDHDDFLFSRNVTSPLYTRPIAIHMFNSGFELVDTTGYIVYDINTSRFIKRESPDALRLEQIGKAILQTTSRDFSQL